MHTDQATALYLKMLRCWYSWAGEGKAIGSDIIQEEKVDNADVQEECDGTALWAEV